MWLVVSKKKQLCALLTVYLQQEQTKNIKTYNSTCQTLYFSMNGII